jgi:3-hydroxyisobutyrate dehydrogenase-like beta-hydroxyacid dehydrogenase
MDMEIGLIGLGDMGLMYAKRIVKAGWKKHLSASAVN